jgi:two-component system OmpR family sensor kinase
MSQPFRKYKPEPGQWSLRNRLVLGVVLLGALGIASSDFAAQSAFRTFLIAQVDAQLNSVADGSILRLDRAGIYGETPEEDGEEDPLFQPFEPLREVPSDIIITLLNNEGMVIGSIGGPQSPQQLQSLLTGFTVEDAREKSARPFNINSQGSKFHYRALARLLPSGEGTVVTAVSLSTVEKAMSQLRFLFLAVGFVVLILLGLISRRAIGISLRPLRRVEDTAEAFARGDFSARLPEARQDTEVGRLTSALNQMLTQIEKSFALQSASEERLRRFVADASHELRTPLTAIRGFSELHRQGAVIGEKETQELVGRIEQESIRMSALVEDLLLLARIDQSREMAKEPVDLKKLVSDAIFSARAASQAHPIDFDFPNQDIYVLGDPLRLHQVVSNLLMNARTHTPPGTEIKVIISEEAEGYSVSVADNGPGLSESDQARIFERFYRADQSRARSGTEGTGLGLSIVDAVMRAHGGQVTVKSKLGEGAVFTIHFPINDI